MDTNESPSTLDVAVYARDIAKNLEAMTALAGLVGLSVLFRACAWEAAESLKNLSAHGQQNVAQKAASEDAA